MSRIHPADACSKFSHSRHGGPEIGFDSIRNGQAEFPGLFHRAPRTGCANDTFGRHASDVQAIPAHQMSFDQGCLRAKRGGHRRGDQPGGPGPDDDDIVSTGWCRVYPCWRMDVVNELLIKLIHRGYGHGFLSMILHAHPFLTGTASPDLVPFMSRRQAKTGA